MNNSGGFANTVRITRVVFERQQRWLVSGAAHADDQLKPLWLLRHTVPCIRPDNEGVFASTSAHEAPMKILGSR